MGLEMDIDGRESRRERSVEMRDHDVGSPTRERWEGGYDDMDKDVDEKLRVSSKHHSKDRSRSSNRREEKDHRSKDRERSKTSENIKERDKKSSRDRRKDDRDEREKDKIRDKVQEKDADQGTHKDRERDRDRKDREKENVRDRERESELEKDGDRGRDKERGKEKSSEKDRDREKEKDRTKDREREREKEREKHRDREKEIEKERDRIRDASEREKGKDRVREKGREVDIDREKLRERDRGTHKDKDEDHVRGKDNKKRPDNEDALDNDIVEQQKRSYDDKDERKTPKLQQSADNKVAGPQPSVLDVEERILRMKEERLQKKSEGASEVLAWVNKSRKLEEKKRISEKEKALRLSKVFEEQDNINQEESDDEVPTQETAQNLGGVKILHGLDKVLEGGAVVLTLKDQSILAGGGINEEVDMLENVEIGEQKRRTEAYNSAKKKTTIYDDKFNDEPGSEKKILPQYDDPIADEGIILDASGRFSGEAEKKLEELRKRIQGVSTSKRVEDLSSSGKILSDYYTQEEMLQFKKPKKKKSLRKKEKLDLDALEAEAIAAGLGSRDLGSRKDGKRETLREEEARAEAQMRSNAFQAAYAKAQEASIALRLEGNSTGPTDEDDTPVIGDDDEDLRKSLERARKLAFKKQEEAAAYGPQVIARLAASTASKSTADNQDSTPGESQENKMVLSEMEEFVWGLELNEETENHDGEDVFMEEDETSIPSNQGNKEDDGGWTEIKETEKEETPAVEKEEVVPDETIHEAAVGKGLAGALKLLKDRGSLKETVEWGGRNMDKKKSKLVGIQDAGGQREIRIERTDEYGRILTPKEAFRLLSHKFHGKGPGKMKLEKRMRQYQEELKVKQMKNADTPSQSVERMRDVQAQLKTPYIVLSGHVKPGQTSDPRSGFATVEKDLPGGLTPMLGDKKVEHFLGLKRKPESGDAASQKKPKT